MAPNSSVSNPVDLAFPELLTEEMPNLLVTSETDARPDKLMGTTCPCISVRLASFLDSAEPTTVEMLAPTRDQGSLRIWEPLRDSECEGCRISLDELPNEVLMHILGFLDVSDLLATSRVRLPLFPSVDFLSSGLGSGLDSKLWVL